MLAEPVSSWTRNTDSGDWPSGPPRTSKPTVPQTCPNAPNDCISGDVFVGKFIGDQDRLLVRCKSDQPDFGQVLVALPIDPRPLWPVVAESLGEFLMKYVEASGDKYWS